MISRLLTIVKHFLLLLLLFDYIRYESSDNSVFIAKSFIIIQW